MEETMMKRDFIGSLLILVGFVVTACTSADDNYRNNQYYQYYISTIRIQNPRVVLFYEHNGLYNDYPQKGFVCPDSAVKYCTDYHWKDREDVFLLNGCWHDKEEQSFFKSYGDRSYKPKSWEERLPWLDPEPFNDTIHISRFFFDEDLTFVLSMHTTAYTVWDSNDPDEGDLIDTIKYANTYRLAVRPKYSWWQNYKIRKIKKETDVCYDAIEYPDTIFYVPTKCGEEDDD